MKAINEVSDLFKYVGASSIYDNERETLQNAELDSMFNNTYVNVEPCNDGYKAYFYLLDKFLLWNFIKTKLKSIQEFVKANNNFALNLEIQQLSKLIDEIDDKGDIHVY